jgi:hypothetical protein
MIVRSVVCPVQTIDWGTFQTAYDVKRAHDLVMDLVKAAPRPGPGRVRFAWEVLENSGLTELAGGVRRLWDPYTAIPPKTVEITVLAIWEPVDPEVLTGQLPDGDQRRKGWDE